MAAELAGDAGRERAGGCAGSAGGAAALSAATGGAAGGAGPLMVSWCGEEQARQTERKVAHSVAARTAHRPTSTFENLLLRLSRSSLRLPLLLGTTAMPPKVEYTTTDDLPADNPFAPSRGTPKHPPARKANIVRSGTAGNSSKAAPVTADPNVPPPPPPLFRECPIGGIRLGLTSNTPSLSRWLQDPAVTPD